MKKTKTIGICVMLAMMLAVIILCVNGCGNADSPDDTTVSEKTAATGKTEEPSAEITETTGKSSAENIETTGLSQGGNISTGATNTSGGGTIVGHTHQYGPWTTIKEPTCLAMGVQERICTCGTMETRNIDKIEHIIVKDAAKVATCTEPGLTEGSHCSMCGIVIQKQEPILALGHDYVNGRCSRCGEIFEQVSQGLQYTLGSNGTYYIVTGIGACKDSDIVIPAEYNDLPVTSIGRYAFSGCSSLTSIEIPSSVTSIGWCAFTDCENLTSVIFGENSKLTSIGAYAFEGCSSLKSIEIPEGVTSIEMWAFHSCSSLMSIKIPSSVTSIMGGFLYCSNLESITVAEGNSVYHSTENCLIETASKTLLAGCKNSVIPADSSVTRIEIWAFAGCSNLTSIEIPSSVTSIGYQAFYGCSSLTSIEISSSVTSIEREAFWGCESLTSITYKGTKAQWNQIEKGIRWDEDTGNYTIHCTDGDIEK